MKPMAQARTAVVLRMLRLELPLVPVRDKRIRPPSGNEQVDMEREQADESNKNQQQNERRQRNKHIPADPTAPMCGIMYTV